MEPELCPPWWPELIWWLLHHHGNPPPPPPDEEWLKRIERPIEELMGSLAVFVQAQTFAGKGQEELREQMQRAALERMNSAVGQLAER
jgi:hypothetical protein